MVNLSELTPLAEELNKKTDKINSIISTVNEKLAKLNLGTEVWAMWLVVGDWTTDPEGTQCRSRRLTYLGYARVEDKWQLAVKHVTEQERWDEDAPRGEQLNTEEVDPAYSPLLSESRSVRTEALKHLDDLFNELKRECEQVIQNIDAAGKAAQAL